MPLPPGLTPEVAARQAKSLTIYRQVLPTIEDGLFLNTYMDEQGVLHVFVKETMDPAKLEQLKTYEPDIIIETVKYSYPELQQMQEIIWQAREQLNVSGTSISVKQNKIEIRQWEDNGLRAASAQIEALLPEDAFYYGTSRLRENDVSPAVPETEQKGLFEEVSIRPLSMVPISPGRSISFGNYEATLGFGVYWNGGFGFITAGHTTTLGQEVYYRESAYTMPIHIGNYAVISYGGNMDIALIDANASQHHFSPSARMPSVVDPNMYFSYYGGFYPDDTRIYLYGAKTGEHTGGIIDTFYKDTYEGIYFEGVGRALMDIDRGVIRGDSGGPVLAYDSALGAYVAIGIQKAFQQDGAAYLSVFTHLSFATAAHGVVPYGNL